MKAKFVLFKSTNNRQYYFSLKAPNGESIGHSEGYTTKQSALAGINATRVNAPYEGQYFVFQGNDLKFYFNLRAANNEIILQSEGYQSKQGAIGGKEDVKRYAPTAELQDLAVAA